MFKAYWRATHPEVNVPNVSRPMGTSPQASPSGDQERPTLPGKTQLIYLWIAKVFYLNNI